MLKVKYCPAKDIKTKCKYYVYSSAFMGLPFADANEINSGVSLLTGGEYATLADLLGGWQGCTFWIIAIIAYIIVTFLNKRDEMKAKKVEALYKKAEIANKDRVITDIVNIDNSLFFQ